MYSSVYVALLPLAYGIAFFYAPLRKQIYGRFLDNNKLAALKESRRGKTRCILFFCSSAGEFEQALPLINRFEKYDTDGNFVHVFFNSVSGINFARARSAQVSYSLAPFDWSWYWQKVFTQLRPDLVIVVRHELWPSFLIQASANTKTVIIDVSAGETGKSLRFKLKTILLQLFNKIFVVDEQDAQLLRQYLVDADDAKIDAAGDTKYDRVIERAMDKVEHIHALKIWLAELFSAKCQYIIIGSAWLEDIKVVLNAYREFLQSDHDGIWKLIIVPHEINQDNLQKIASLCRRERFTCSAYSELLKSRNIDGSKIDIVMVDKLGNLAEFYGIAHLAVVGGAFHFRVHNVLEPAVYGVPVVHGPKFEMQKEAVQFVAKGVTSVAKTSAELLAWLRQQAATPLVQKRAQIMAEVRGLAGASDRIFSQLMKEII